MRRFDEIVLFPPPSRGEIQELLARHFRQLPLEHSVRIEQISISLEGASHAAVERMALDALKETILEGQDRVGADVLGAAVARQRERQAVSDAATAGKTPAPVKTRQSRKKSS